MELQAIEAVRKEEIAGRGRGCKKYSCVCFEPFAVGATGYHFSKSTLPRRKSPLSPWEEDWFYDERTDTDRPLFFFPHDEAAVDTVSAIAVEKNWFLEHIMFRGDVAQ